MDEKLRRESKVNRPPKHSGIREEDQEPKLPSSQKTLSKKACRDVLLLREGDFGQREFEKFCKNMTLLAKPEGNSEGVSRVTDQKNNCEIYLSEKQISISRRAAENPNFPHVPVVESFYYKKSRTGYQPIHQVKVTLGSINVNYRPYLGGGTLRSGSLNGQLSFFEKISTISNNEIKALCAMVYLAYENQGSELPSGNLTQGSLR